MDLRLKDAREIDSFVDLTDKNIDNYRSYRLLEFSNQEYGISVTEYKAMLVSGKEVIKYSAEKVIFHGAKEKITNAFEKTRETFSINPDQAYSKLLEKPMQKFQLNEGEVLTGTVKNIKPLAPEGNLKMAGVVIEVGDKTITMKVQEQFLSKFQPGQMVSIKNTAEGIQAQIVPKLINKLKM